MGFLNRKKNVSETKPKINYREQFHKRDVNSRNLANGRSPYTDSKNALIIEKVIISLPPDIIQEIKERGHTKVTSKGGAIYFSNEINKESNLLSKIKNSVKSVFNKLILEKKIDAAVLRAAGPNFGYTIKKGLRGRWYDPNSKTVIGENSYGIEIRGIPFSVIEDIGFELLNEFEQESVLVINFETNDASFIFWKDNGK